MVFSSFHQGVTDPKTQIDVSHLHPIILYVSSPPAYASPSKMSTPGEVLLTIQEEGTKQQPAAAAAGDGPNLAPSDACPSEFLKDKKKFDEIKQHVEQIADGSLIDHEEHHHDSNDDKWHSHTVEPEKAGGGSFGSRCVGGHKPRNRTVYDAIEAVDYQHPDTVEESLIARIMTDHENVCCGGLCCSRSGVRRSVMWMLYIFIGASVSLLITGVLSLTGWILDLRVAATKDLLQTGDIGTAWLSWTGSSLVLCLFAVSMVLIEPAAASSGIPGLIAFLNGVQPNGMYLYKNSFGFVAVCVFIVVECWARLLFTCFPWFSFNTRW